MSSCGSTRTSCPNAPALLPVPISLLLRQGVAHRDMQLGMPAGSAVSELFLSADSSDSTKRVSPRTPLPLHSAHSPAPCHTKGLEMKAGICVGGQAAAQNTCLLFLCRQKECVGNTTNEHLRCGVIFSCYLKTTLQTHPRQKLSNNSSQSKGRRGSGTSLGPMLVAGRWAGSNTALAGPHSTMGSMPSETQKGDQAQAVHFSWQKVAKRFLPEPGIIPDSAGKGSQQQSNLERGFSG